MNQIRRISLAAWRKYRKHPYLHPICLFSIHTAIFFFFFILCDKIPFVLDDYFSLYINHKLPVFSYDFENVQRVATIHDLFLSAYNGYLTWGGRFFCSILTQGVLIFDKSVFNFLNSLMFVFLIILLTKHIAPKQKTSLLTVMVIASVTWLCAPAAGQTLFIAAITITYLWFAVLLLLLLLPYRSAVFLGNDSGHRPLLAITLFFLGIIACNSNENTAAAMIILELIFLWNIRRKHNRIPLWSVLGIAGSVIGYLIMTLSPGITGRIAAENHQTQGLFHKLFIQSAYLIHIVPALLAVIFFMSWHLTCRYKKQRHPEYKAGINYLYGALFACYIMIVSPYSPSRAMFGPFVFLVISAGILFELLSSHFGTLRFKVPAAIALLCIAAGSYMYAYRDISLTSRLHRQRLEYVNSHKASGQLEFTFRQIIGTSKYNPMFKTDVLSPDATSFINRYYAHQLGISSIRTTAQPAITGMEESILPDYDE